VNQTEATRAVMFDHAPIGVAVLDESVVVVDHNPALARMLGAADTLIGRFFGDLMHSDDIARDAELRDQLMSGELPYYQVQKRMVHSNGAIIWARLTVSKAEAEERRFVVQVEDVTEVRRAKDMLERRALYDHLTGLANRTLLLDRLAVALEVHENRNTTVGVIYLDLDHFKLINDSFGHEAGDTLLLELARRMQDSVRAGDTVARLGGDEFVIVLENIANQAAAEGLLSAIAEAVHVPFVVEGHEVLPTVSAGLAMAEPGVDAERLVRNADIAAYNAKKSGRARVEVFSPALRNSALSKLSIESELRTAIREGELVVHYQPVVELSTRAVVAFEALVRWQHPSRGLLLPDEFIEVCEEANLVVPLGAFVLNEACQFIADNPEFGGRVFVNVSTRQIGGADLTRFVSSALAASGIEPHRLCLEITESGMLLATHDAHADLQRIKDLGVDLVIDDFGTGYSALSSVLQSPVAGLKLAREFTLRLGDRSTGDRISTTIATLAHSLDMYGVIEGVETEAQFTLAKRHGWTFGQGFLFGHATAAEDITFRADGTVAIGDNALLALGARS
jgi:diguanylate cyclase (GGDEF)-like protein/PAS domain S-box-containing protein